MVLDFGTVGIVAKIIKKNWESKKTNDNMKYIFEKKYIKVYKVLPLKLI